MKGPLPRWAARGIRGMGGATERGKMFRGLVSSERAQEFEPFRMLIAAVFALAVLVIIIGAVNYFEGLRLDVSKQRFLDGLNNAVKQPNRRPLQMSGIQVQASTKRTSLEISKIVNLPEECILFGDGKSRAFLVSISW